MDYIRLQEEIAEKARNGDWSEIITLQTKPDRDDHHARLLSGTLLLLDKELSAVLVKDREFYLVELKRYFGVKPLNQGFFFVEKEDAKKFVKQYKEMMEANDYLQGETGEKIVIIEMKLVLEEKVEL